MRSKLGSKINFPRFKDSYRAPFYRRAWGLEVPGRRRGVWVERQPPRGGRAHIECTYKRGCTLALLNILEFVKDWESVILGVWVAPGAFETLQQGGGEAPHLLQGSPGRPGLPRPPK
jgi:hypothetical protein